MFHKTKVAYIYKICKNWGKKDVEILTFRSVTAKQYKRNIK